ncbi:hypothetical protein, partial [Xanthobacter autotrophicus]|uniref:hypothetical protein n=1 Tax=Xanthobacter autotrophicus TaxID=280 RepID=UPI0024A640BF
EARHHRTGHGEAQITLRRPPEAGEEGRQALAVGFLVGRTLGGDGDTSVWSWRRHGSEWAWLRPSNAFWNSNHMTWMTPMANATATPGSLGPEALARRPLDLLALVADVGQRGGGIRSEGERLQMACESMSEAPNADCAGIDRKVQAAAIK